MKSWKLISMLSKKKASHCCKALICLVPLVGFELTTYRLQVCKSGCFGV